MAKVFICAFQGARPGVMGCKVTLDDPVTQQFDPNLVLEVPFDPSSTTPARQQILDGVMAAAQYELNEVRTLGLSLIGSDIEFLV